MFVHPVQVCDADPGAPKEAMLRGTPVVACGRGGIRSRIKNGMTGVFAETSEGFAEGIKLARTLDREKVRQAIMDQCDPAEYGRQLEALCKRVAEGERW